MVDFLKSYGIVNKFIFQPPYPETYEKNSFNNQIKYYTVGLYSYLYPGCYLIVEPHIELKNEKYDTIVFFHGNASDLGSIIDLIQKISNILGVKIICFEYPGYGILKHTRATEYYCNMYAFYFYLHLLDILDLNKTIFWGLSLGTGILLSLINKLTNENYKTPSGIILTGSFLSIKEAAYDLAGIASYLIFFDRFINSQNIQNIPINTKVLLIHGEKDEIFNVYHSKKLLQLCSSKIKQLIILPGKQHNDLEPTDLAQIIKKYFFFVIE